MTERTAGKRLYLLFFPLLLLLAVVSPLAAKKLAYPPARVDATVIDDYFGTQVADPYRWLEDPDSPETMA